MSDRAKDMPSVSPAVLRGIVRMQALVRTKRARAAYGRLLFDKYAAEEEAERDREQRKLEEGLKLLDRVNTERQLLDKQILGKLHSAYSFAHAPRMQRVALQAVSAHQAAQLDAKAARTSPEQSDRVGRLRVTQSAYGNRGPSDMQAALRREDSMLSGLGAISVDSPTGYSPATGQGGGARDRAFMRGGGSSQVPKLQLGREPRGSPPGGAESGVVGGGAEGQEELTVMYLSDGTVSEHSPAASQTHASSRQSSSPEWGIQQASSASHGDHASSPTKLLSPGQRPVTSHAVLSAHGSYAGSGGVDGDAVGETVLSPRSAATRLRQLGSFRFMETEYTPRDRVVRPQWGDVIEAVDPHFYERLQTIPPTQADVISSPRS